MGILSTENRVGGWSSVVRYSRRRIYRMASVLSLRFTVYLCMSGFTVPGGGAVGLEVRIQSIRTGGRRRRFRPAKFYASSELGAWWCEPRGFL